MDEWVAFAEGVLGMVAARQDDESVRLRIDGHAHRYLLRPAEQEGVDCIGWQLPDEAAFDAAVAELESLGHRTRVVTGEQALTERAVSGFVALTDPAGTPVEFFYGAVTDPSPFVSKWGCRFVTGHLGIGHVVLSVADYQAVRAFYESLGFRLSDRGAGGGLSFYRCSPRQHSLALGDAIAFDFPQGVQHLMLEVDDIDAVGRAYDACLDGAAPLTTTLGRHSNDRMISFYVRSPSGFDMELGFGGLQIDEATWEVSELGADSSWGHRPLDGNAH